MLRKEDLSVQRLVITAMCIAMYVILERFLSFNAWNMRIGFAFVALAAAGIRYGSLTAGCVGALGDLTGMLLFPTGPYFPGFTLNAFLTGAVFGCFLHRKQTLPRTMAAVLINQMVLSLFVQTLWISITYGAPYRALLATRIVQCAVMLPVQMVVTGVMAKRIPGLRSQVIS